MNEPRKLYFEGKFVGEVPNTGDLQTDLKAMSKLLDARGAPKPRTRCQAAFRQAAAFAKNAEYLFNTGLIGVPPRNPINVIPFAVNAAFAIELYLKTLGCLYGHERRGHDLLKLFDNLPDQAKEQLRQEVTRSPPTEGIKDLSGFRTEIGRVRHVFEEWRYLHERDSSATEIRFLELTHVLSVLHNKQFLVHVAVERETDERAAERLCLRGNMRGLWQRHRCSYPGRDSRRPTVEQRRQY